MGNTDAPLPDGAYSIAGCPNYIGMPEDSFRALAAKAARCDRVEALLDAVAGLLAYASTRHVIAVEELSEVFDAADAVRMARA